jgi:hypothetical protein
MPDVAIDAPQVQFTGEYVDWDSTDTAFCGIMGASFEVRGSTAAPDHTAPNGRFVLEVPGTATSLVDITPPTSPSGCTTSAMNQTYAMPGIAVADPAVIATGQLVSLRDFTTARQSTLGATLDSGKGHVFVHVDGTQAQVSLSTTSDMPQAWNGTMWAAGAQGVNVFFPNVAPGMATVSMGSAIGGGSVPVEAGKITYVTLVGS